MILAVFDDWCLHFDQSPEDRVCDVEALGIDTMQVAFDDQGQRYVVEWIEPNASGLFGLMVSNGKYRLVRDGEPDPRALLALIQQRGLDGLALEQREVVQDLLPKLTQTYEPKT